MAPPFLLLLLFGIIVTAQNNQGTIDDIPLHPAGQRNEKRQEEQQQIAECEQVLRRNHGEDFCYRYLDSPRTKIVYTAMTTTKYGRPVIRTVKEATTTTFTRTRTVTEDISFTTTTTTTTITAPPTSTITLARRDGEPLPWYLHRKCSPRHIRAACRNFIKEYPPTTVTRTRTRTAFERPTILTTRTYIHRRMTKTTTTTYLSTSTVTAIETSTVPHPCDNPSNTQRRVVGAGVFGTSLSLYERNSDGVGETECCRRCWDESQCNGWAYFDGNTCYRLVALDWTGATETCPKGLPTWTALVSLGGLERDVTGHGSCGVISIMGN